MGNFFNWRILKGKDTLDKVAIAFPRHFKRLLNNPGGLIIVSISNVILELPRITFWGWAFSLQRLLICIVLWYLWSGSVEVITPECGQRHHQGKDKYNEGWDDEAKDAGVATACIQLRRIRVVTYEEVTQPSHTLGIFFCLVFLCFDPVENFSQCFLIRHIRATVWLTA